MNLNSACTTSNMRARRLLVAASFLISTCFANDHLLAQDDKKLELGAIEFFGYGGLNLQKLRQNLPIEVGDSLTHEEFDRKEEAIKKVVEKLTGRPPTDVAAICCDAKNRLLVYIGLSGSSYRPMSGAISPRGTEHLDPLALKLYEEFGVALEMATSRGVSQEDRSLGYALSADLSERAVQLQVRGYAIDRESEIVSVLRNSGSTQQREASAYLLGYVRRSPTQIQSIADAATDSAREVRNNAVRALSVLSSATNAAPLKLNPRPLIAMLFSGVWTDRNKGSLLLQNLTQGRDPAILYQLQREALPPLIEGARWKDLGHANAFLVILGRIGSLSEIEIEKLIRTDREKLIQAASLSDGAYSGKSHP